MSQPSARARTLKLLDWLVSPRAPAFTGLEASLRDRQLSPLLNLLRRLRRLGDPPKDAQAMRQRFSQDMASLRAGFGVGGTADVTIDTAQGTLPARLYRPSSPQGGPLLVYFHGGGFIMGDLDTHDDACRLLCEGSGMPILSVAYRLAPEAPFPAAIDDALAASHWARQHACAFDAQDIAVGGDSAGANLAAVTALRLAQAGHAVAAQLLIYPGTDRTETRRSHRLFGQAYFLDAADRELFYQCYLGADSERAFDWRVSPQLATIPKGLAPALVVTAGYDMLRDEGSAYANRLKSAAVPVHCLHYARLVHGFINLASVHRESRAAVVEIAKTWGALCDQSNRKGETHAA